ncbi:MAG TPA: DUF4097 family beta strand repeat-containing protein [Streptosporangiaceae bacterium]|nr:DUF4097 family beta strand repeat-containing protein [Streptosporangiaceae bacterium]
MNLRRHRISALVLTAAAASLSLAACGSGGSAHDQRAFGTDGTRLVIDDTSSWTLQGDALRLGIDCSGLVFSCGSRFEVAVPPAMRVIVNSGSNAVTISGLSAPVTVNGNQGGVNVSSVSGPLRVSTGAGSVTATALLSSAVRVTTSEGDADISFAAAPRSVTVKCSAGNATVKVPTAGHRYHVVVSSGSGNALSKVPDSLAGSVVRVSSDNGDATVLPAS